MHFHAYNALISSYYALLSEATQGPAKLKQRRGRGIGCGFGRVPAFFGMVTGRRSAEP